MPRLAYKNRKRDIDEIADLIYNRTIGKYRIETKRGPGEARKKPCK